MKQNLLNLKSWLLIMCLLVGVGSAWAEKKYIIDFNKGNTSGTTISTQLPQNASTFCESGDLYIGSFTGDACYYNASGCGIRIAKSKGDGLFSIELNENIKSKTTQKVIIYASKVSGNNTSSLTVTPSGTVTSATTFANADLKSYSSSDNSEYQLSDITINGTLNSLQFGAPSGGYVMLHRIDIITTDETDTRKAVNITNFSTAFTTLTKGNTATTSVTNDQTGWTAAYTYNSDNTNVATIDEDGVITAVGKGTAKITANLNIASDDANYKNGATSSMTIDITVNNPSHIATFHVNGEVYGTPESVEEGAAITFPVDKPSIENVTFIGWTESEITGTQDNAPDLVTNKNMGDTDANFFAVFATANGEGEATVKLSQTLQYDTWTYSGSTTNKSTYRLFHSGSYIESAAFDLSTLSKVVVYGGTFGGDSYNKLTIGDGTNTWKSVTVSGSSQTGKNTYSEGVTLTGTNKLRITSNSGSASSNGVRISKVEIYTIEVGITYSDYSTTVSTKTLSSIAVKTAPTKVTYTEDEKFDPAGLVITATYDDESTEDIAYEGNESKFTFNPTLTAPLTPSNTSVTITYNEKSCNQAITVNAIPTYTLHITQPEEGGTLTVKNGEEELTDGASVRVGTKLTCEVTDIPDGKRFSRFYATYDNGNSNYKSTNPATFENIPLTDITDVTISVAYKDASEYTIAWSINGEVTKTETVIEGTEIIAPTVEAINGKSFIGWSTKSSVDAETGDLTAVSKKAKENVTYYAVFATVTGTGEIEDKTITLDFVKNDWGIPVGTDNKRVEETEYSFGGYTITLAGNKENGFYMGTSNNKPVVLMLGKTGAYLKLPVLSTPIKKITCLKTPNTSVSNNVKWNVYAGENSASTEITGCADGGVFVIAEEYQNSELMIKVTNGYNTQFTGIEILTEGPAYNYSGFTTTPLRTFTPAGTIKLSAKGGEGDYYATFSSNKIVAIPTVPSDDVIIDILAVSVNADGTLEMTPIIPENAIDEYVKFIIPANTGVLIQAVTTLETVPEVAIEYTNAEPATGSYDPDLNMLRAGTVAKETDGSYKFYKLAYKPGTNQDPETLGFYYGAAGGAAFDSKPNLAYLAVPNTPTQATPQGFRLKNDEATGINSIKNENNETNVVYNLNGQRISSANGFKGIVIVNGKKMLNK